MFKNIYLKLILTSLLSVSLFVACAESSTEELMTSNQEVASDKGIAPSLQNDEAGSAQSEGGTLKRLWGDPPTLDPHLVTDTTSAGLVVEMFSGLGLPYQGLVIHLFRGSLLQLEV